MTSISTSFAHVSLTQPSTLAAHAVSKGEVDAQIQALIGTAPGVLDTLGEIAASLNQDGNMYTSLSTMVTNSTSAASAALLLESNRAIAAEGLNRSDREAALVLINGTVTSEVTRAEGAELVLGQRITDTEFTLIESINGVNTELGTEVSDRAQAIQDEAKARADRDGELQTAVDSKANLAGATFTGNVTVAEASYLYIGTKWRIAASGSDLEFQYSADGATFSVGVPFISA